jgi:1,4-alpha-glucan branching enzyme
MGGEIGQSSEWNANGEIQWWLLGAGPYHRGLQRMMEDLNRLYAAESALWQSDYDREGFYWIDASDNENSVLSFVRQNQDRSGELLVVLNLTPVPRYNYRLGFPRAGKWIEIANSDAAIYGGGNVGNLGGVFAEEIKSHNHAHSAELTLPPLAVVAFRPERKSR